MRTRVALVVTSLTLAACGGDGGDVTIDASGADAAVGDPDAVPTPTNFITIDGVTTALPFAEAYLYSFDGTTSLVFRASSIDTSDCFEQPGCVAAYLTLPEDAPLGDLTCATPGTQLTVDREGSYFAAAPLVGVAGASGSCAVSLDARGAIGTTHAASGLAGTLLTGGFEAPSITVQDGAFEAPRGADQAPPA